PAWGFARRSRLSFLCPAQCLALLSELGVLGSRRARQRTTPGQVGRARLHTASSGDKTGSGRRTDSRLLVVQRKQHGRGSGLKGSQCSCNRKSLDESPTGKTAAP